jgi:polyisoprenyl-phosphate glycosyltransferase
MKLSIIIPVYKGENTIVQLFNRIQSTLSQEFKYEVIFVNDCAVDNSWHRIKELQLRNPNIVKGFNLKYNYGQHKTLLYGIKHATGEYLVTMDEDMQHDPYYIPGMISYLEENKLDVVYGKFEETKNGEVRSAGSKLGRRFAVALIPGLHRDYSPFRIIRTTFTKNLQDIRRIAFIDGLLAEAKAKTGVYTLKQLDNQRPSSYSFFKLVMVAISAILCYSRKAMVAFWAISAFLTLLTAYYTIKSLKTGSILPILYFLIVPLIFMTLIYLNLLKARLRKNILVTEKTNA